MNTPDHILASAMEKLAESIVSDDGVANAAIREAGQRITELSVNFDAERERGDTNAAAFHAANESEEKHRAALAALMPFVLRDFEPGTTTRAHREAVENACALLGIKPEAGGGDE